MSLLVLLVALWVWRAGGLSAVKPGQGSSPEVGRQHRACAAVTERPWLTPGRARGVRQQEARFSPEGAGAQLAGVFLSLACPHRRPISVASWNDRCTLQRHTQCGILSALAMQWTWGASRVPRPVLCWGGKKTVGGSALCRAGCWGPERSHDAPRSGC